MRAPNPFRDIPNKREVWAWGMYDLANQSFTLLIITVLFPIYFKEVVVGDPRRGDALWSIAVSTSLFLVVLASPLIGAGADARRVRKPLLLVTGVLCAALTMALSSMRPGWIAGAMALFIGANLMYQIGENLLACFLPGVSTPRTIGRISAIGWTMGYLGALVLLAITLVTMLLLDWRAPARWWPYFLLAGLWFVAGMIPPAIWLKEPAAHPLETDGGTLAGAAWARLTRTVRHAAHFKQLFRFLLAFLIYGFGVQTMIAFAAILASDFGIKGDKLIIFTLQLTITAGVTAALTARFQDRIGAKLTILVYLGVWFASAMALWATKVFGPVAPPQWIFWTIGNGIGIGLGGIGTSSRSLVGRFTPAGRTAEFFGLWGMTYKLAGAIGVLSFGQVKAWIGDAWSLGLLASFFGIGLLLTLRVNERAGLRAARRSERSPH